jgi:penicillin-binding protein 1A
MAYRKIYQKTKKRRTLILILKLFCFIFLLFVFCFLSLFIYYSKDLPRPERFTERQMIQSTKIFDRTGEVFLYEIYGEEKRTWVSLEKIPEHLKQAVIAAEDQNFYKHFGIDLTGIARAVLVNLKIKKPLVGGSTIPQQLIRSTFLSNEKTAERKIREIILSIEINKQYSKDQILEWYLNQIPLGSNCYGVEAASQTYFKKSVSDISLPEAAILASLIKAPTYLSPYGEHKEQLLSRKDYVLKRMEKDNYISRETAEATQEIPLNFAPKATTIIRAPHFAIYVKTQLEEEYGEEFLRKKGLKIYTSLDWELQEAAETIIEQGAKRNENYNAFNASLTAIDPKTGEILAMVGSKNWYMTESYPEGCSLAENNCLFAPKFNVAASGNRQPGSAFKPFAFAQAFKKGFTPETILWDVETNFGVEGAEEYIPGNYDEKFRGHITMREALAQSINVPSVKTLYLAGIAETINLAKSFGITTLNEKPSFYGLSLVLGGGGVKLLDMVSSYGVFATRGLKTPPVSILKIEDLKGDIIKENKKTGKRVLESEVADLINDILSDNNARAPMFGFASPLYFENYQVAVKTGTSQEYIDAWTIGYTPSIVAGVWVGNNNNKSVEKPGVMLSAPMWRQFMEKALIKFPEQNFVKPEPVQIKKPVLKGEVNLEEPHSILYYLSKNNPREEHPENPSSDSQYKAWEQGIQNYLNKNK